jgi:Dynein heavy chain, N-terminal region 2
VLASTAALSAVSTEATAESRLEELLAGITQHWASVEFTVVAYRDSKDVYMFGSVDDVQAALEDSFVKLSTISASRYVAGISADVQRVEGQLRDFSSTLDSWVQARFILLLVCCTSKTTCCNCQLESQRRMHPKSAQRQDSTTNTLPCFTDLLMMLFIGTKSLDSPRACIWRAGHTAAAPSRVPCI